MAELVVGPLLSLVKNKAGSYLLDQYKVMEGKEKQRKILERKLPAILDIIQDAEENVAFRPGVAAWLKDLKTVAYKANDIFDEFNYEALRREANEKGHHSKLDMEVVTTRNPIVFRYRMGKKLDRIVQTIEVLVTEMNAFGFRHLQETPPSKKWRQTDPIMIDSDKDIVSRSRDREMNKIVGMLLGEASNMDLVVLPIVGVGGLGKTTFVQLIYNNPAIERCFELQRWCCVSDDFDVANIARNICQNNGNDQGREKELKNLQSMISGKRFLIVLDDVWNRDEAKWGKLITCLRQGGKGSVVLATTRDAEVARIMKMGISAYNIEKLCPEHLKEIIESRAFSLQKPNNDELDGIVDTIVDRCAGSPLAAKAFGSILSSKTSVKEWKDISAKSSICNERTGILPILKLSFDELPSHMKQWFGFCAIFPKGYEIDVELLIHLWMAHDFMPVLEGELPETAGEEVFKELTWRSFFEEVKQTSAIKYRDRFQLRNRTVCKMHDLMHDIAVSVLGKEGVSIVDTPSMKKLTPVPASHLFLSDADEALMDDLLKKQSPTLRTIFCKDYAYALFQGISKYTSLRALHLPMSEYVVGVRHLQHLRYLNLSDMDLEEFPEDISILYNLQTLSLSGCKRLRQLPKDLKYMASLRHLYTNGCESLMCMPPGLRQITSLQTLTYFVSGANSDCSTISELQNLNLGGELELSCLENATEALAKAARLENKEKLTHLALTWKSEGQEEPVKDCHKKVLCALKPHGGLQMLRIINYKGNSLPPWVTDLSLLQHLTELHLIGCICEEFPRFCHLKALQVLYLEKLNKLQILCSNMASAPFPALKEIQLHDLEILERWVATEGKEDQLTFPVLEEIDIKNCPKLTSLPEAPRLKVMRLDEHKALLSLALVKSRQVSSLSKLQLHVHDTEATPPQIDQNLESSLSELFMQGCHFFFSSTSQPTFGAWKWFRNLVTLRISDCDVLIYWPEEVFQNLVSLKNLGVYSCNKLIGPTKAEGDDPTQTLDQVLPCLNTLDIVDCESLTELFIFPLPRSITLFDCPRLKTVWGNEKKPETLENLCLFHCDNLVTLPNAPPSLKSLEISSCGTLCSVSGHLDALEVLWVDQCNKLQSLESLGDLPSLETLTLQSCSFLASLPGSRGSYSALRELRVKYCPAIDMMGLYKSHQQLLDSLEVKDISHAHSSNPNEGPKLREPKTWHYAIPWCRDWVIQQHTIRS